MLELKHTFVEKQNQTKPWKNKKIHQNIFFDPAKDPPTRRFISPAAEQEMKKLSGNSWSLLGNTQPRKRPTYVYAFSYLHLVLCTGNLQVNRETFVLKKLFWDTLTEAGGIHYFYFIIQRAEKNLPLARGYAIKLWQMRLSEGKYSWNLAPCLLLCRIRGASKTVESLRKK